jgi:pimeloyl-ACP methyl ester carboxylesterase
MAQRLKYDSNLSRFEQGEAAKLERSRLGQLQEASPRRLHIGRIFKWLTISVTLILAAGSIYQLSMTVWETHRYPPRGKLVDIGGLRLHINCTGAGSPTVILDAGPNDSSLIWQLVQPEISKFTGVCSYDRAGFGWSDAPNEPRSSSNIASELDRLLTRANVPGPYVLVGHDFGTLDLRVFTARHRQQVAGMVFVDSVHPDIHHRPPFNVAAQSTFDNIYYRIIPWTVPLGVPRILGWCRANFTFPNQPKEWARLVPEATAQYCRLRSWRAEQAQVTDEDGSSFRRYDGSFGDLPLIVLSHDPEVNDFGGFFSPADLVKAESAWMEMQAELRTLSSRSKWIVAKGSPHWIQIHRPELVAAEVQEIVNDAQRTAPFQAAPEEEYK